MLFREEGISKVTKHCLTTSLIWLASLPHVQSTANTQTSNVKQQTNKQNKDKGAFEKGFFFQKQPLSDFGLNFEGIIVF